MRENKTQFSVCNSTCLYVRVTFLVSDTDNSKTMSGNLGRDSNVALDVMIFLIILDGKCFKKF